MIKKYKVFTTPVCPNCHEIKQFLAGLDLKIDKQELNAMSDDGLKEASRFAVSSVPTVIFFDENRKEIGRAYNVDQIKAILNIN